MERPKENGGVMGWGPEKGEWFGAHGGAPPPHPSSEAGRALGRAAHGPGSREEAAPWPRTADCLACPDLAGRLLKHGQLHKRAIKQARSQK